jgi:hypothetical protein
MSQEASLPVKLAFLHIVDSFIINQHTSQNPECFAPL